MHHAGGKSPHVIGSPFRLIGAVMGCDWGHLHPHKILPPIRRPPAIWPGAGSQRNRRQPRAVRPSAGQINPKTEVAPQPRGVGVGRWRRGAHASRVRWSASRRTHSSHHYFFPDGGTIPLHPHAAQDLNGETRFRRDAETHTRDACAPAGGRRSATSVLGIIRADTP